MSDKKEESPKVTPLEFYLGGLCQVLDGTISIMTATGLIVADANNPNNDLPKMFGQWSMAVEKMAEKLRFVSEKVRLHGEKTKADFMSAADPDAGSSRRS